MVSANVTTEIHALRVQPVLQVHQAWTANQVTQENQEPRANLVAVTVDTSRPPNLAKNAHLVLQDQKGPLDLLAKEETKANQVTTVVWARTEASDPLDQPDPPEIQVPMANQEASDQQEKTVSQVPKVHQVMPEAQAKMVVQDQKDPQAPMATQDQQDQPAAQARKDKTVVQARKVQLAKQVQLEFQAKTPNIALAQDEAIKCHLSLFFKNCVSQLLQFKFQLSFMSICFKKS